MSDLPAVLLDNRKVLREILSYLALKNLVVDGSLINALDCLQYLPVDGKGTSVLLSELQLYLDAVDRPATMKEILKLWE